MTTSLFLYNSVKLTVLDTSAALYTLILVDDMRNLYGAFDSANGTISCTLCTALTEILYYGERKEGLTYAGGTLFIHDMSNIFIFKIHKSGENRIRCRLSESAECA